MALKFSPILPVKYREIFEGSFSPSRRRVCFSEYMDILGSFVSIENRRMNCASNTTANENSSNNTNHNSNGSGNKTSFLIDDILFPAKLRNESTRQVRLFKNIYLHFYTYNISPTDLLQNRLIFTID